MSEGQIALSEVLPTPAALQLLRRILDARPCSPRVASEPCERCEIIYGAEEDWQVAHR